MVQCFIGQSIQLYMTEYKNREKDLLKIVKSFLLCWSKELKSNPDCNRESIEVCEQESNIRF